MEIGERLGVVIFVAKLPSAPLVYVEEEGTKKQFVFTCDKIKGYRGQRLKELKSFSKKGICDGVLLKFTVDETGERVSLVRPLVF